MSDIEDSASNSPRPEMFYREEPIREGRQRKREVAINALKSFVSGSKTPSSRFSGRFLFGRRNTDFVQQNCSTTPSNKRGRSRRQLDTNHFFSSKEVRKKDTSEPPSLYSSKNRKRDSLSAIQDRLCESSDDSPPPLSTFLRNTRSEPHGRISIKISNNEPLQAICSSESADSSPNRDGSSILKYGNTVKLLIQKSSSRDSIDTASQDGLHVGTFLKRNCSNPTSDRCIECTASGSKGTFGEHFSELNLQIADPFGLKSFGTAVRYGDSVFLVDEHGHVLNTAVNDRRGYMAMRSCYGNGEILVSFKREQDISPERGVRCSSHNDSTSRNEPKTFSHNLIRFGDSNVVAIVQQVVGSGMLRNSLYTGNVFTVSKKDPKLEHGNYLCCNGRGSLAKFSIVRTKAFIRCITVNYMEHDSRNSKRAFKREEIFHNAQWKKPILFEFQPLHIMNSRGSTEPAVTLHFTNAGHADISMDTIIEKQGMITLPVFGEAETCYVKFSLEKRKSLDQSVKSKLELLHERAGRKILWLFAAYGFYSVFISLILPFLDIYTYITAIATISLIGAMLYTAKRLARKDPIKNSSAASILVTLIPLSWEDNIDAETSSLSVDTLAQNYDASQDLAIIGDFIPDVVPGCPPMPKRFLVAEGGDMAKASVRWKNTANWRLKNEMDAILDKPHLQFDLVKQFYKHHFHLPDRHGHMVYYEIPGKMNLSALKAAGVDRDSLLRHYCYCMEYLWVKLQPKQIDKLTIVIDCEGVGFMEFRGEPTSFLKSTVSVLSTHYPQRSFKIIILNAPNYFNAAFSLVKPMLNENTRAKISVIPPSQMASEMVEVIAPENLPPKYGGTCTVPLGQSPAELSLRSHAMRLQ